MRRLVIPLLLVVAAGCTTTPAPAPPPAAPAAAAEPAPVTHGFTIEEEARVLAMEDRREYDAATVDAWATHPNALHRQRIALALAHIGPHTFVDANGNNERDPGEKQAGVDQLIRLASDRELRIAETAVFALGEIGDPAAVETLVAASMNGIGNEGEAVEALSKLAKHVPFARYATVVRTATSPAARQRAVRFLFRFDSDESSALAAEMLEDPAVRQEAAYSLSRRPVASARERLELLVGDANTLTRAYAVAALGRIGAAQSAPLLIAALGDIHPWVRTNAAVALSRIAAKDASFLRADDLPRVLVTTEDPDAGVRSAIIDTIGYYAAKNETARTRLREIAVNGSRWERELAAAALAKHFNDPVSTELTGWGKVRVLEATGALPRGAELRRRWAGDPDVMVRAQAIGAIPDADAAREEGLLTAALAADDVIVRASAIDRYAKATALPAATRLTTLRAAYERTLRDRELNDARLAAINAIAEIDHPERESFLRSLLVDSDPVVRRLAADLIENTLKKPRPQFTPLPVSRTPAEYAEIVAWARQPHTATIHMTRGLIELALLTQDAPMTAWNFAQLAKRGYFDNTTFMRVVPNFVVQGGDPRNDQNGGPGYSIRDEINLQKYTRGAVGMALSGPDTGGSQFFITHSAQPHLDGGYTIFARVYDGMGGVVDQTERGDRVETIRIDEHAPVGQTEISAVTNVSLPTEIGRITEARIVGNVPDYARLRDAYAADESIVELIADATTPSDRVEIYMGTWCPDSQREVPKFLKVHSLLRDKYGKDVPVSFVAVDRSKTKPADLLAGKHVEKVATFIWYRDGAELGRIVETPRGLFEDNVLQIVSAPQP
ncbi:MAG TPA: peptidylprolyl isomerase [Thermoanaerobaculia bacterium]|jgi:cyclophilin family peptidyl-prolyl cis-trans isomerase/HEAT repeat protein/thiol-disulfide isomerase/thioredoxin